MFVREWRRRFTVAWTAMHALVSSGPDCGRLISAFSFSVLESDYQALFYNIRSQCTFLRKLHTLAKIRLGLLLIKSF